MSQSLVPFEPQPGQVGVRWLGQGGFVFRSHTGVLWSVDPYLSSYSSRPDFQRLAPPPVEPEVLQVDAVLCTHAHTDHVDPIALPEIAQGAPSCRFYAAAEGVQKMRELGIPASRVRTVEAGQRGIAVSALGSYSTDVHADVVFASHSGDAVGYIFHVGDEGGPSRPLRIYVTGDTLYDERLISDVAREVDLLCVCINGRGGNMTHEEAARLAGELSPRLVIPMHFGVMPHNTIDPQLFLDALKAQGVNVPARVLAIGESILVSA